MDLTEFLLARIAEDEAVARAATAGPWCWTGDYPKGNCPHGTEWTDHGPDLEGADRASVIYASGYDASSLEIDDADAEHIARHDPARVLAECEAKRRIVANHAHSEVAFYPDLDGDPVTFMDCEVCVEASPYRERGGWCLTLRALALPDVDHPDYDPTWRP